MERGWAGTGEGRRGFSSLNVVSLRKGPDTMSHTGGGRGGTAPCALFGLLLRPAFEPLSSDSALGMYGRQWLKHHRTHASCLESVLPQHSAQQHNSQQRCPIPRTVGLQHV